MLNYLIEALQHIKKYELEADIVVPVMTINIDTGIIQPNDRIILKDCGFVCEKNCIRLANSPHDIPSESKE